MLSVLKNWKIEWDETHTSLIQYATHPLNYMRSLGFIHTKTSQCVEERNKKNDFVNFTSWINTKTQNPEKINPKKLTTLLTLIQERNQMKTPVQSLGIYSKWVSSKLELFSETSEMNSYITD